MPSTILLCWDLQGGIRVLMHAGLGARVDVCLKLLCEDSGGCSYKDACIHLGILFLSSWCCQASRFRLPPCAALPAKLRCLPSLHRRVSAVLLVGSKGPRLLDAFGVHDVWHSGMPDGLQQSCTSTSCKSRTSRPVPWPRTEH